jgi:hypothetical protein
MIKGIHDKATGYQDREIPYLLTKQSEAPKGLAIILPGVRYTAQSPYLRYSVDVYLNHSYDILEVNYQYFDEFYKDFSGEDIHRAVKFDVKQVVDQVLKEHNYDNYVLIGKSLGTIALSSELNREAFSQAKAVWITPLLSHDEVFQSMMTHSNEGLCFIGDQDQFYVEDRYNQLQNRSNIDCTLFPNLPHSLDYEDDPLVSIDVLKSVIRKISLFDE